MKNENMVKASQTADLLFDDLRQALKSASELESILILDAMETAGKLRIRLEQIAKATAQKAVG